MRFIKRNLYKKKVKVESKYGKLRLRNLILFGLPISIVLCGLLMWLIGMFHSVEVTDESSTLTRFLKSEQLNSELEKQNSDPTIALKEELLEQRLELQQLYNDNIEKRENVSRGSTESRIPTYDYEKLTAPKNIVYAIEKCAYKLGFKSIDEIYPIVGYESHFNPKLETKTKREHSIGLLMVNTWTNYPKGKDINKLKDAEFNLNYQLPELYEYYCDGREKGMKGMDLVLYMVKYCQRPDYSNKDVRSYIITEATKYYKEITAAKVR